MRHVAKVDGRFHHRLERGASRHQDLARILENAFRLGADLAGADVAGRRVDGDLAADEKEAPAADSLRIRSDRFRRGIGVHDLSHVLVPPKREGRRV